MIHFSTAANTNSLLSSYLESNLATSQLGVKIKYMSYSENKYTLREMCVLRLLNYMLPVTQLEKIVDFSSISLIPVFFFIIASGIASIENDAHMLTIRLNKESFQCLCLFIT